MEWIFWGVLIFVGLAIVVRFLDPPDDGSSKLVMHRNNQSSGRPDALSQWLEQERLDLGKIVKGTFIGFDFSRGFVVVAQGYPRTTARIWTGDILEVQFGSSGQMTTVTTTKTNRGSQIAGAAVGGAVFGPLGAAVGALSGSKTSTAVGTEQRQIFIFTNNRATSSVVIDFDADIYAYLLQLLDGRAAKPLIEAKPVSTKLVQHAHGRPIETTPSQPIQVGFDPERAESLRRMAEELYERTKRK